MGARSWSVGSEQPMALASFSDLKTQIGNWTRHTSWAAGGEAADFIVLGEAWLNRTLGAVETEQALTGTTSSREIDTSSYSIVRPLNLFLTTDGDEIRIRPKDYGAMPRFSENSRPGAWAWSKNAQKIYLDHPCDQAHTFRLTYRQRFALATTDPNWLLTNHPDVYLAACLVYGTLRAPADGAPDVSEWKRLLASSIPQVKKEIAATKRATAKVDKALLRGGNYDIETDQVV